MTKFGQIETIPSLVCEKLGRIDIFVNNAGTYKAFFLDTRWGTPEEIANLILFAVPGAASYVNCAELVADNAMEKS